MDSNLGLRSSWNTISSWIEICLDLDLLGIRSALGLRYIWIQIFLESDQFLDRDLLGFKSSVKFILLNCYRAYKCNSFLPVTFMHIFSNLILSYLILSQLILSYLLGLRSSWIQYSWIYSDIFFKNSIILYYRQLNLNLGISKIVLNL